MKYLCLFIAIMAMASCEPKDLPTSIDIKDDYAVVKMSHMTTEDEMIKIQTLLKEKCEIDFNYSKSTFFEGGKLRSLSFEFRNRDGHGGKAFADLMSLQNHYYGMIYNPGGNPSMKTGSF